MKVYILIESDHDGQGIKEVYASQDAALVEAKGLLTEHMKSGHGGYSGLGWHVETWEVQE